MSMDYYASYGYYITWEDVKKVIPEAAQHFESILDKYEVTVCEFLEALEFDNDYDVLISVETEDDRINLDEAYMDLVIAFKEATRVGNSTLEIAAGWLNEDDDICYDVENPFFWVYGVTTLTDAAMKVQGLVNPFSYVSFG